MRAPGFATGHQGVLLRTEDGGDTWKQVDARDRRSKPALFAVRVEGDAGIAVGAYGAYLESADAGRTWTARRIGPPDFDRHLTGIAPAGRRARRARRRGGNAAREPPTAAPRGSVLKSPYEGSFFGALGLRRRHRHRLRHARQRLSQRRCRQDAGSASTSAPTRARCRAPSELADGTVVLTGADGMIADSRDGGATFAPSAAREPRHRRAPSRDRPRPLARRRARGPALGGLSDRHARSRAARARPFGRNWVGVVSYYIFHWRDAARSRSGVVLTLLLGWSATRLEVQAGFSKMLPLEHPYMQTFLKYQQDFGGANKVLVAVKARDGDIFSAEALAKLKAVHEDLFFMRGVERSSVLSLYSPNTIFMEVVEDGFRAGPVLPSNFKADARGLRGAARATCSSSQWVGRIVASDFSARAGVGDAPRARPGNRRAPGREARRRGPGEAPRPPRGRALQRAHHRLRQVAPPTSPTGAAGVIVFFGLAAAITALLLLWYTRLRASSRRWRSPWPCVPVVWLLGLLPILGLTLDPMSILVPFLIFSIGVSHAVQMTNAWKLEALRGRDALSAARIAFVKLFIPGASALLANAIGFLVIAFVKIEMVQELVLTATLGVTLMIVTNKVLLPILLSHMRLAPGEARRRGPRDRRRRAVAPARGRDHAARGGARDRGGRACCSPAGCGRRATR